MNRFIKQSLLFISPFLALFVSIELFLYWSPNTFNRKARFQRGNLENIRVLILGSSHCQNAINPKLFKETTSNLAFGGQDLQLDSALFFSYVDKMSALRQVILELDYHTMEEKVDSNYFRFPWYYKFHGIEMGDISLLRKVSLYASEPDFFKDHIGRTLDPTAFKYEVNEFGFVENDFPGDFKEMQYDTSRINDSAPKRLANRHKTVSQQNFEFNRNKINSIIDYCRKKNIGVVLITTPAYITYRNNQIPEKNVRRRHFIDSISQVRGVRYFNFEQDTSYKIFDFKNDDHLNPNGAKKFSVTIAKLLD